MHSMLSLLSGKKIINKQENCLNNEKEDRRRPSFGDVVAWAWDWATRWSKRTSRRMKLTET